LDSDDKGSKLRSLMVRGEAGVKVKSFSWVGVSTNNFDDSIRFFRDLLGLEVWVQSEQQAILKTATGQQLEIFGGNSREQELAASPVVAFEVDNIDAARQELRAAGIELIGDIGRWNGFAWQYFRSPDGHIFEIKSSPD
jgi:lactoylglutathione lyase